MTNLMTYESFLKNIGGACAEASGGPPFFWGGPVLFLDNYQYIVMTRRAYTCAL